ncbi:MAG: amidohydrolase family protein [Pseudomonadota bacterium]
MSRPPLIDVHCHVMSGRDMPIAELTEKTLEIQEGKPKAIARAAGKAAARMVRFDQEDDCGGKCEAPVSFAEELDPEADLDDAIERLKAQDPEFRRLLEEELAGELACGPECFGDPRGGSSVRCTLRWTRLLRKCRSSITRAMVDQSPALDLYVPMTVDMDYAFGAVPDVPYRQQIHGMRSLVGRWEGTDGGVWVHPFVSFDPRRKGAMKMVEEALSAGFIGVKLYPVMGYLPTDPALEPLFAFCEEHGVPITTHTSWTGAVSDAAYKHYADPDGWAALLKRHERLRIDLAHFGGYPEADLDQPGNWAGKIIPLLERYDLVYVDTAFHIGAVDERRRFLLQLSGLPPVRRARVLSRMMYASDWHMTVPEGVDRDYYDEHLADWREVFGDEGREAYLGGNAMDFLGLREGGATRKRLMDWYKPAERPWWLEPGNR